MRPIKHEYLLLPLIAAQMSRHIFNSFKLNVLLVQFGFSFSENKIQHNYDYVVCLCILPMNKTQWQLYNLRLFVHCTHPFLHVCNRLRFLFSNVDSTQSTKFIDIRDHSTIRIVFFAFFSRRFYDEYVIEILLFSVIIPNAHNYGWKKKTKNPSTIKNLTKTFIFMIVSKVNWILIALRWPHAI